MDKLLLEDRCGDLFGDEKGAILYGAMLKLAAMNFCVATAWNPNQVSIAKRCDAVGRVFELTPDCEAIYLPDGKIRTISRLRHSLIERYLPKTKVVAEQMHCYLDSQPLNHAEL